MGKVDQVGIERAVAEYTGLDADSDVHGKIISAYNAFKTKGYRGSGVRRETFDRFTQ